MADAVLDAGIVEPMRVSPSPRRLSLQRFLRHRLAVVGAVVLVVLVLVAVFGPLIYGVDPNAVNPRDYRAAPSSDHLLGTDSAGRDVLARLLVGARVSLSVGVIASLSAAMIGTLFGALAGYVRSWTDAAFSRLAEVVQSFPSLIVIVCVAAVLGPSLSLLIILLALTEWPGAFRVVRGMTMSLREQDSVLAAVGLGASGRHIIYRHVLPTVLGPITVVTTLLMAAMIMTEAALSYLGLGVPPPTATWGSMLSQAQSLRILESMPWLWLPPGLAIAITVLSVNFVGDGLRDALDPTQSR